MNLIHAGIAAIVLLLIHHRYTHRNDVDKTEVQKWFQWEDVNNHETVVALIFGFLIGLLI